MTDRIGVLFFGVRSQDDYGPRNEWGQGGNQPIAAGMNGSKRAEERLGTTYREAMPR